MKKPDPSDIALALSQKKPTKKISVLRGLMPEINEAIRRGLSKKEIWDSIQSSGMDMPYKLFIDYLSRIRKREKPALSPTPAQKPINETESPISATTPSITENGKRGMSPTQAALAEMRQQPEIDYAKVMRDHLKSLKKEKR